MTDFNNPNNFDKYGNPIPPTARFEYEPVATTGRAPYVLLGLLVLIGIVGGAMYFNGGHRRAADVATAPPAMTDTRPAPMAPMTTPATPAPAGPTQQ
jgi:hypothetical protein